MIIDVSPKDVTYSVDGEYLDVIISLELGDIRIRHNLDDVKNTINKKVAIGKMPESFFEQFELFPEDKPKQNGNPFENEDLSHDGWVDNLKKNNLIWTGNTSDGIKVPIGFISPTKTFDFYLANDNDPACYDFHALIAGGPGYGKTVLLHNIIINAAMKYSPDELCFYLADFAEGASFSIYKKLPHVKSLMLANNKEFAFRMLDYLAFEAKKRSDLFKMAQRKYGKQVTNLALYRELTGEKLPRIVLVMDEFHYLFLSTDPTSIAARETLCNGLRQWWKFGINIILSTQSICGVNFGDADEQITYRFALHLQEMDSKLVIRNNAAKLLTRKGQTIMNNSADGIINRNIEFQSAFSKHYLDDVEYLARLYEQTYCINGIKLFNPFICESGTDADIVENRFLYKRLISGFLKQDPQCCMIDIGKPDLLREIHTSISYQRRTGSNTLVIGNDYKTLIFDLATQLIQIQAQSHPKSKICIADCFNKGEDYQGALDGLKDVSDVFKIGAEQSAAVYIDEFIVELERRKEEQKEGIMYEGRMILVLMNAQNCYELKPQQGKFNMEQSPSAKKLATLLAEGGPFGIHCIVHCLSYDTMFNFNGVLTNKEFPMFENVILLKGADVANMFFGTLKVLAPEESGLMVVIKRNDFGDRYEQCKAYSDITVEGEKNAVVKYLSNLFEKYRYA